MAIHALAIVDPQAEVHPEASIGPFCVVQGQVVIERGVELRNHATVYGRTRIGEGSVLFPHCVVGSDPQDLKFRGEDSEVRIGKRCRIHENVTISKGTLGGGMQTIVGDDCLLMAGSHIAHDCVLAEHIVIGNQSQLAGHIRVGRKAIVSAMSGVHHFVTIGELAFVGGMSGVAHDVPPYTMVEGNPALPRAINQIGLRRDGIDDTEIRRLKDAFRPLFGGNQPRAEALATLRESGVPAGTLLARLCDWLDEHLSGSRKGRMQEAQRQPTPTASDQLAVA